MKRTFFFSLTSLFCKTFFYRFTHFLTSECMSFMIVANAFVFSLFRFFLTSRQKYKLICSSSGNRYLIFLKFFLLITGWRENTYSFHHPRLRIDSSKTLAKHILLVVGKCLLMHDSFYHIYIRSQQVFMFASLSLYLSSS